MTKALVTGGTGFIGSNLVKALLRDGFDVRIFDNQFRGVADNLAAVADDIEIVSGDIRDGKAVAKATDGCDHVYHLAFVNGTEFFYTKPDLVMDVGIRGHFNVMDACQAKGVSTFVYASSSEIYQMPTVIPTPENVPGVVPDVMNPRYSYGGAKLIGELLSIHYAKESKMKRIIFRPHNVYGPAMGFEHVIPQIVHKICRASHTFKDRDATITIQGTGSETRAFCYVDDAVEAIRIATEKGEDRSIYHIGTEQETKIADLIRSIAAFLDIRLTVLPGELQKGGTPRRCPDISKLKSLGYKPAVSLQKGLTETVKWYRDHFIYQEDTTT